jgi:integrase
LSCLSKFYDYGMREVELLEHSPVANVRRPKVSEDSPTIGLDAAELDRLLTAAEADGPSAAALVSLLVYNGLRIAEALRCDVEDVTYQRGHRVLRIVRKGGAAATDPLAPIVVRVLRGLRRGAQQRATVPQPGRHCPAVLLHQLQPHPPAGPRGRHPGRGPPQPAQPPAHCPCFVIVLR